MAPGKLVVDLGADEIARLGHRLERLAQPPQVVLERRLGGLLRHRQAAGSLEADQDEARRVRKKIEDGEEIGPAEGIEDRRFGSRHPHQLAAAPAGHGVEAGLDPGEDLLHLGAMQGPGGR
jgi:hypothetical protein